jgi:hypothetical protein
MKDNGNERTAVMRNAKLPDNILRLKALLDRSRRSIKRGKGLSEPDFREAVRKRAKKRKTRSKQPARRWSGGFPMSATARDVLVAFDKLSAANKHEVTVEILRRSAQGKDLPEQALAELADELFRGYDAEEAGCADPFLASRSPR